MATAAVLPPSNDLSFKYATEMVERWAKAGPTNDEILDFLEIAAKDLSDPENAKVFSAAMEDIGKRAASTDEAFDRVKRTMDNFVKEHGSSFPGIVTFQLEWHGYKSEWSGLITTSRDFAIKTSAEYEVYTLHLELVEGIKTKEELDALAESLKELGENKPVGIPIDFKDMFLELRRKVVDFQARFNVYLDQQGVELENKAKALKTEIESLKLQVAGLDQQVKDATLGLEIASIFGPLGAAIAGTALAVLAIMRANKQKELDGKKADLKKVEDLQSALGSIKAQFAGLVPDFELLTTNLNLFADTWNAFHNDAVDFATKFKALEKPDALPELYKRKIRLALAASAPLSKGLKDYAAAIHA